MNAYLMAAGCATRLRPVTTTVAKCLLKVAGTPIIEYWLEAIIASGQFENVFVNVHHCADQVEEWLARYSLRRKFPIKIIDERSKLLGTAGTLYWHGDNTDDLMLIYTDTYSQQFIKEMRHLIQFWKDNPDKPLAGLITFPMPDDASAGAVETDFMGTVTKFSEKSGVGLCAWAGIMLARAGFIAEIKEQDKDLARDVFPRLCGTIRVLAHVDAYDIGRGLDTYADADRKIFPSKRN